MLEYVVGYEPHFNATDFVVATEEICDCGRKMTYRGFKKGDSYRCFIVCETCDKADEF